MTQHLFIANKILVYIHMYTFIASQHLYSIKNISIFVLLEMDM